MSSNIFWKWSCAFALATVGVSLAGCQSDIRPLENPSPFEVKSADAKSATTQASKAGQDSQDVETPPERKLVKMGWEWPLKATPASKPTTQPASQPTTEVTTRLATTRATTAPAVTWTPYTSATTQAATTQSVASPMDDHDLTSRFIYKPSYDLLWKEALKTLSGFGYTVDRSDYRLGTVTTVALPSSQFMLFWNPDYTNFKSGVENAISNQRRVAKISITPAPGKADFVIVSAQVLVERRTDSSEVIGGPIFTEGSGFGRSYYSLRSDYAPAIDEGSRWITVGHDVVFEKRILDKLFKHI